MLGVSVRLYVRCVAVLVMRLPLVAAAAHTYKTAHMVLHMERGGSALTPSIKVTIVLCTLVERVLNFPNYLTPSLMH